MNICHDPECAGVAGEYHVSETSQKMVVRCQVCGKLQIVRIQERRGLVTRHGLIEEVVETSGEIEKEEVI